MVQSTVAVNMAWLLLLLIASSAVAAPSCQSNQTLREYSKEVVLPLFTKLTHDCVSTLNCTLDAKFPDQCDKKADVLALRDALNVWNFAWFPLGAEAFDEITWPTVDPPKHGTWEPSFETQSSHDPLNPLLYYVSVLYTTLGSIEDARAAKNHKLAGALTKAANLYLGALQVLLGKHTDGQITAVTVDTTSSACMMIPGNSSGVTWDQYLTGSGGCCSASGLLVKCVAVDRLRNR